MMQDFSPQARTWEDVKRIAVLSVLWVSAMETLAAALMIGLSGSGDNARVVAAGLLLFGAMAIAVAVGFRKVTQPNWKHWVAIVVLGTPGALTLCLQMWSLLGNQNDS